MVTVLNGVGSGSFSAGSAISISANEPPAGRQFAHWTADGVTLADANAASTTFVMPAQDVVVTAVYEDIPDTTEPDATEPDATEPPATEPDATEPDVS
jgi:hypothetical protein